MHESAAMSRSVSVEGATLPNNVRSNQFGHQPQRSLNTIRYTNGWVCPFQGNIYLGDDKGRVHCFDQNLKHLISSPPILHGTTVFGIVGNKTHIFTRDTAGNITCWNRNNLTPSEFLASQHFAAPINPSAPSPSNAIEIVDNELWVSNSRGSVSVFTIGHGLLFKGEMHSETKAFPERIKYMPDGSVILTDVTGCIWQSDRTSDFKEFFAVGAGVVHSIEYDVQFDRYWLTSDICGSVLVVDRDGTLIRQVRLTEDDVEEIVFSDDGTKGYVACFDHYIHIVDVAEQPMSIDRIGPFKFQLSHLKKAGLNLLVILESGEAYLVDPLSHDLVGATGGTDCVWNFEVGDQRILCPTESGRLLSLGYEVDDKAGVLNLTPLSVTPPLGYGRIRKALSTLDGASLLGTTSGRLVCLEPSGDIRWEHNLGSIIRDISLSPSGQYIVCGTEAGVIKEIMILTGEIKSSLKNSRPVWCVIHAGEREIIFGERRLVHDITTIESDLSKLVRHDFSTHTYETLLEAKGNFKRIFLHDPNTLLVASNTEHMVFMYSLSLRQVVRSFKEWIINTPENACIVDSKLYAITYSQQVLQYDLITGAIESVEFSAEGYPKVLHRLDGPKPLLLVAGRGFLSQYAIPPSGPELVRTWFLDNLIEVAASHVM